MSQSATDEHGVTITPEVSANGKVNEVAVGVKTSVQVSNKVINKIDKVIATKLNVQVSTTMLYTEKQNITLKAGKLTAIKTSWQRRFATGTVVLGRDSFTYEAALGYMTSREIKEYASVEDMPPDLLAEYRRLHPAYRPPFRLIEGSVLREKSSAPVYVIYGGAKFWIPDPQVLQRLYGGWAAVTIVDDNSLANVPTLPRDGTILREEHDAYVWRIEGGKRRHITTPTVLNQFGGWNAVRVVPDNATSPFPVGDPIV
ncbi:MAG: hypothetical protein ACXWT0_10645 [Methylobacter sp.]